jgi:hypothetical protein
VRTWGCDTKREMHIVDGADRGSTGIDTTHKRHLPLYRHPTPPL